MKIKDALDTVSPDPELIARTQALMESTAAQPPKKAGRVVAFPRRAAVLAACLLLVIGLSAGVYAYRFAPVSSIYLDAEQSLALEISRSGNVVGVDCYDSAAKSLVAGQSLRGEKAADAVAQVLAAAKEDGSLKGGVVSLAVCGKRGERDEALLSACTQEVKSSDSSLAVYSTTVQSSLQSEAEKDAISPGKLTLIKMIQKLDGSATVSQYRDAPVSQLVDRLVYLTSDANTAAPETQKAAVRSDIQSVAQKRAAALPVQAAPTTSQSASSEQPQQAAAAPVCRPTVPAATQSVGETGGSSTVQAQQPDTAAEAPTQTGGEAQASQQPADAGGQTGTQSQMPSGQQTSGTQPQTPGGMGETQQSGSQASPSPDASTASQAGAQPDGGQQPVQPSRGSLGTQGGGTAPSQQLPSPSNGDEGK